MGQPVLLIIMCSTGSLKRTKQTSRLVGANTGTVQHYTEYILYKVMLAWGMLHYIGFGCFHTYTGRASPKPLKPSTHIYIYVFRARTEILIFRP